MTNTELLRKKIAESGLKVSYVAEYVGITRSSFWKKVHNKSPFNQYEIESLCNVLKIDRLKEKENIFFAKSVD